MKPIFETNFANLDDFGSSSFGAAADGMGAESGSNTLILTNLDNVFPYTLPSLPGITDIIFEGSANAEVSASNATFTPGDAIRIDYSRIHDAGMELSTNWFDAGAVTQNSFEFFAGQVSGFSFFNGGSMSDQFFCAGETGATIAQGGAGDDVIHFGAKFQPMGGSINNRADGGVGNDTLDLNGDYTVLTGEDQQPAQFFSIERMNLHFGHSYSFATTDPEVAAGETMTVNGAHLGAEDILTWDGSAETDGSFILEGGAGDDVLTGGLLADTFYGGGGNDHFDLSKGGADTVYGGGGNDVVYAGAQLDPGVRVDGGAGIDDLVLSGDYSAGLTLSPGALRSVEVVTFDPGNSYTIATSDTDVAAGHRLTADGSALGAHDVLTFNGSGETNGYLTLFGGAGDDVLTGGAMNDSMSGGLGNDIFNLQAGGNDTANGNDGDDVFNLGGALTASDRIDGGSGNDTLNLAGSYTLALNGATIAGIETLHLAAGFDYALALNEGNVAAGHSLKVDASALGVGDILHFSAVSDTDARFVITGGAGNDIIAGGGAQESIDGGLGADVLKAGAAGHTEFVYAAVADSTGTGYDVLQNFSAAQHDTIKLPFLPSAIALPVTAGTLSTASFNSDLAAAVSAAVLPTGDAVFFTPDSGTLAGRTFLIVDANGQAGYQAGQDYVLEFGTGSAATGLHFA